MYVQKGETGDFLGEMNRGGVFPRWAQRLAPTCSYLLLLAPAWYCLVLLGITWYYLLVLVGNQLPTAATIDTGLIARRLPEDLLGR